MYQLLNAKYEGDAPFHVKRLLDNAVIPFDPANSDYAEYLKWLEEGNTPLPAENT